MLNDVLIEMEKMLHRLIGEDIELTITTSGDLWPVKVDPGQGTTVRIYLPRVLEEPSGLSAPKKRGEHPGGKETVLLVEDEEVVRAMVARILQSKGYTVLTASNGAEALKIAEKHIPGEIHLLLTDVVMPKMGGRELVEKLEKMHPKTKVLYMSGHTDDSIARHGILEPGIAFMQKPFSPEDLAGKVRQILDSGSP